MTSQLDIVIPVFHYSYGIEQLFNHVAAPIDGVSFFICDDSRDSSVEDLLRAGGLLAREDIAYERNALPRGVPNNWNMGLHKGDAAYKWLLHHDEWVTFSALERILEILRERTPDVVVNDLKTFISSDHKLRVQSHFLLSIIRARFLKSMLFSNFFGTTGTLIVRSELLDRFDNELMWYVDCEWYYRLFLSASEVACSRVPVCSKPNFGATITDRLQPELSNIKVSEMKYIAEKFNIGSPLLWRSVGKIFRLMMRLVR